MHLDYLHKSTKIKMPITTTVCFIFLANIVGVLSFSLPRQKAFVITPVSMMSKGDLAAMYCAPTSKFKL